MTDRPILFRGPLVRAIIRGDKTETRRLVKPQPLPEKRVETFRCVGAMKGDGRLVYETWGRNGWVCGIQAGPGCVTAIYEAPYAVGDRLWVREAFWSRHDTDTDGYQTIDCGPYLARGKDSCPGWDYVATPSCRNPPEGRHVPHAGAEQPGDWWLAPPDRWDGETPYDNTQGEWEFFPWDYFTKHPSIHMPRWASRLTLAVKALRVERLQAIDDDGAIAEGVVEAPGGWWSGAEGQAGPTPRDAYAVLWDSINGPGAWSRNPWVIVIGFSAGLYNIDASPK